MLQHTFCHVSSVGPKTENRLWAEGVRSWSDALDRRRLPLGPKQSGLVHRAAEESLQRLASGDAAYFYARLPAGEQWRLFDAFRPQVAYFDIETTGLGAFGDYVTTIALYDGRVLRTYVHEQNLQDFADDLAEGSLLVSYNGKSFDVPFLRRYLGLPMRQPHIDLRHLLGSLGYRGGLKLCEQALGLSRDELEGVDGYTAVLLWYEYLHTGSPQALETLLAYNAQDVLNLEILMVAAYNLKVAQTPFAASECLGPPTLPGNPFHPDAATLEALLPHVVSWDMPPCAP